MSEASSGTPQAPVIWRMFDEDHPPRAVPSLIYLLEGSNGRLLLDDDEPLYPGALYLGPLALAPRVEAGSTVRGIQIATPVITTLRRCKTQIPVVIAPGTRTRLLAGSTNTCTSPLPWPGALIDLRLDAGVDWTPPHDRTTHIIVIAGQLSYHGAPMPAGGEHTPSGAPPIHAIRRSHALIWHAPRN